jgi:hypothetical protein
MGGIVGDHAVGRQELGPLIPAQLAHGVLADLDEFQLILHFAAQLAVLGDRAIDVARGDAERP